MYAGWTFHCVRPNAPDDKVVYTAGFTLYMYLFAFLKKSGWQYVIIVLIEKSKVLVWDQWLA